VVSVCRAVMLVPLPLPHTYEGECGGNWRPAVVRSYCSHSLSPTRIGEGVAKWCPCVVRSCWFHYHCHTRMRENVAVIGVRQSCGRVVHTVSHTRVLGRVWLNGASGCREVLSPILPP
jgi:hypothetical protein